MLRRGRRFFLRQHRRRAEAASRSFSLKKIVISAEAGTQLPQLPEWRTDDRAHLSMLAGENERRALPHKNVVKELPNLGRWDGPAESFTIPPPTTSGLRDAIIVQEGRSGPIIAAARAAT